jgi:hypothetical protein
MSNRSSVYTLMIIAPVAWGGLLLLTYFVAPNSLVILIAFFLILAVALTSTFAPLAYIIGRFLFSSRIYSATIRHALRQGALLSLALILNLILLALHSWNIFTALAICAAAVLLELLSLARK